jgi:hypothetical protein
MKPTKEKYIYFSITIFILVSFFTACKTTSYELCNNDHYVLPDSKPFYDNGIKYQIIDNSLKLLQIIGYDSNKNTTSLFIPDYIDKNGFKYKVTKIRANSFENFIADTLIIANTVEIIEELAFLKSEIRFVSLPNNSKLTIQGLAFAFCANLSQITIHNNTTLIAPYAFSHCTNLDSINIPDSLNSIGSHAFDNTRWYNNQPDGVVYIGKILYQYKGTVPKNTTIQLNKGTLGIAREAFENSNGIVAIFIPSSVINIGYSAFNNCNDLQEINVEWEEPSSVVIGDFAFPPRYYYTQKGKPKVQKRILIVPKGTKEKYKNAEVWKKFKIKERNE